jgi:GH35 family endo-1,4-beta-xylanase
VGRISIFSLASSAVVFLLAVSGCGTSAPAATTGFSSVQTENPTSTTTATSAPAKSPAATPDPFSTWSTNFASATSPADVGTVGQAQNSHAAGEQLSIETANVNSGGKAIKDSGVIDSQHPLITSFNIRDLIGRDSFDFSDKNLNIELFVPADSPVSTIHIALGSQNQIIFGRWLAYAQKGRWYTYSADLSMLLALGSWQYEDWLHPAGFTGTKAVNLIRNVQWIHVYGTAGTGGSAYLLIDHLGWTPSGPLPAHDPSVDSLWKYANARNLPIVGNLGMMESSDPQLLRLLLQEFTGIYTEQANYWPATEPAGDNFDAFVRQPKDIFQDTLSARLGTSAVRTLLFDHLPDWLITKSYEETKTILENYVRAQVSRHKGKTKIWFLFTEFLRYDIGWTPYTGLGLKDRNQYPQIWENNYSPFSASPSDLTMIGDAFRVAHETDPDSWLYLCEGAVEEKGQAKPDAFYNLAAKLLSEGVPIKGVGLEAHLIVGPDNKIHDAAGLPYALAFDSVNGLTGIAANVERYQALGLDVVIAAADVAIYLADIDSTPAGKQKLTQRLQIQAEVYRSLMHITLTHSNMPAFIFFSWADLYSWTPYDPDPVKQRYGDQGIFDADYKPKPAYYALLEELKGS